MVKYVLLNFKRLLNISVGIPQDKAPKAEHLNNKTKNYCEPMLRMTENKEEF